jgi:hypothetical protein
MTAPPRPLERQDEVRSRSHRTAGTREVKREPHARIEAALGVLGNDGRLLPSARVRVNARTRQDDATDFSIFAARAELRTCQWFVARGRVRDAEGWDGLGCGA